ncbi:MAG: TonB family protein [Gemmatimonadetes bacterium]|nr:TonB family protein [Gemmatimonadota bacterium]
MMTTLLESGARPYSSKKGIAVSMLLHGALVAAAVFATSRVVLPPREKIEEHPILYVATPPPPPITPPPEPLPVVKTPPKAKAPAKVFKAPPAPPRRAPQPAPQPRPVAQVPPKGPTTPALVAPTRISVTLPPINPNAAPTVSDVVAPPPPPAAPGRTGGSGIPTSGTASRDGDAGGSGRGGLSSGGSGKAYDEDQVDQAVQIRNQPAPRYPDALRSVGVEGTVLVRFIVDADGRVERGSIEAIDSPNKLFTDAVRTALLNSRYRPAEAGGNKVRQLVEQSFTFRLQK